MLVGAGLGAVPVALSAGPAAATGESYAAVVGADSPLGYWRLEESSGSAAADSSGHGRTGTFGASTQRAQSGVIAEAGSKAAGTDDGSWAGAVFSVPAAGLPQPGAAQSWELWWRARGVHTTQYLFRFGLLSVTVDQYGVIIVSGDSGTFAAPGPGVDLRDGVAHQLVVTASGSSVTVLVDGSAVASGPLTLQAANAQPLQVGVWSDVDEVATYGQVLSAARVAAHWSVGAAGQACGPAPSGPYAGALLADNPVGYWRLGEKAASASARVAWDAAGGCRNGSYVVGAADAGGGAVSGDVDGGARQAADNVAVRLPAPALAGARTVEVWFREQGADTDDFRILTWGDLIVNYERYNGVKVYGTGLASFQDPSLYFHNSGYHHFVVTWDGTSRVTLFYDGVPAASGPISLSALTAGQSLSVGDRSDADEVAVYDGALAPSQISRHWALGGGGAACAAGPVGRSPGAVVADRPEGYWRLGEKAGSAGATVAFDSSGNCGNGAYTPGSTDAGGGAFAGDSDGAARTAGGANLGRFPTPSLSGERSVVLWFREQGADTDNFRVFTWGDMILNWERYPGLKLYGTGLSYIQNGSLAFHNSGYHQIAVTWDGTTARVYYDGGLVVSGPLAFAPVSLTDELTVGDKSDVDDVSVYSTALAADRVAAQWNANQPPALPADAQLGGSHNPSQVCKVCSSENATGPVEQNVAAPIDTASGNFWHTFTDLAVGGRGPGLVAGRTYNSRRAGTAGMFGDGWWSPYDMNLTVDGGTGAVTVRQENASTVTFTPSGTAYTVPSQFQAGLVHEADGTWTFTRAVDATFRFDTTGRLTSIRDLEGNTVTLTRPSPTSLVATDPAGRTLTFTLSAGLVTAVADPSTPARTAAYTYTAGYLTEVTDVAGGTSRFHYTAGGLLDWMRSPRWAADGPTDTTHAWVNTYDAQGRVTAQKDPGGATTLFDYTTVAAATIVTSPAGRKQLYRFQDGNLVARTYGYQTATAATWAFGYDPPTGGLAWDKDPAVALTTYRYDNAGNQTRVIDPLRRTTTSTYTAHRRPATVTDPAGVTTTWGYDPAKPWRPVSVSTPLLNAQGQTTATRTTSWAYEANGDLRTVTDPRGKTTTITHDPATGDVTAVVDPLGNTTTTAYNTVGWPTSTVSPRGNVAGATPAQYTTTLTHDPHGRVLQTKDPLWSPAAPNAHQTTSSYDPDGNIASRTDGNGNITTWDYDPTGRVTVEHRPDGTTLGSGYDPDGLLVAQIDGANKPTTYHYDAHGRGDWTEDPLGRRTTTAYDSVGRPAVRTDPSGRTTTTAYDTAGRPVSVNYSDPATPDVTAIGYDTLGRRNRMVDGTGTTTWAYDSLGRLTSSVDGAGATVGYGHDLAGNVTSIVYPAGMGTVSRVFDDAGRLSSVVDLQGRPSMFTHDPDSQWTGAQLPDGTLTTNAFDRAGRVTGISHAPTGAPGSPLAVFDYGRDGAGKVNQVTSAGVPADTHSYGYTPLNQLAGVDPPGGGSYRNDTAGNLVGLRDGTTQTFDIANQLTGASRISPVVAGQAGDPIGTAAGLTVNLPAVQPGDQILIASTQPPGTTATPPAGYAQVSQATASTSSQTTVWRKTATAADTSVTVAYSGLHAKALVAVAYRGVNPSDPIDATATAATGSAVGTTVTVGSMTTTVAGERLVLFEGAGGTLAPATWVQPAGMTQAAAQDQIIQAAAVADQPLPAPGATGNRTATYSTTAYLTAVAVTLRPAVTAFTHDPQGNRTSATPPGGPTATYGYDQANRLTTAAGATHTYRGDGLRTTTTPATGPARHYTWDEASTGLPLLLTDGVNAYVYGQGGQILQQTALTPHPPISRVGVATGGDSGTTNPVTVSFGFTTQPGDQILLSSTQPADQTGNVPTPTGYTKLTTAQTGTTSSDTSTIIFTRTADGTETAATITYNQLLPYARSVTAAAYRGADPINPIDTNTTQTATGTTITAPTATTTQPGDQLVLFQGATGTLTGATWTAPTMTERAQHNSGQTAAAIADQPPLTNPGPTGTRQATLTTTATLTAILIALRPPPDQIWFHHDQLGSVRLLTNQGGKPLATTTYDPYGQPTTTPTATTTTPIGYTGQYTDPETGLIYLRNRYYEPSTGQFLTRDPLLAQTRSAYGYVDGNPLNGTDPSGLYWGEGVVEKAVDVVVGGTVAGGKAVTAATRAVIDVAAVVPYSLYNGSYQAAKGLNCLGSKFGPVGSAVSHYVVWQMLVAPEGVGLVGDIGIDAIKAATFGNESLGDEGRTGYINPLHDFLPGPLKGPEVYLPGVHRDGNVDFEW